MREFVSDAQWEKLASQIAEPRTKTGLPRADDRQTLNVILCVLVTGCRWNDLPREILLFLASGIEGREAVALPTT